MKNFTRHAFLWIALFMFSITGFSQTTVTIGTGTLTDRYPLGDYYVYQQSQMLFLSSEIGAAGTITHLRWYRSDAGANSPGGNVEIWLKESPATSIPDGTWETPGTLVSSITGIDLGPGDAWVEIDITDFVYSGTSNLLVSTYVQNAPYTSPHAYFRYTSTSPDYMMRRGQSDSANPPSLFTSYNRPNIQFDVLTSGPENPASFTAVAASTVEIDLDWTQNISSDNVLVAWSSDGIFGTPVDGSTYTNGDPISGGGTVLYYGSALHYDHLGLTDNTQYFYRAWSYDGSVYSFGIIDDAMTPCAVISSLPFFEGFNSASTTQNCWTVLDENGDGDAWDMDYTTNPYEGDQVAMMYTDFNSGANDDYLISPAITLTGNERLKFWQRVQSSGEPNDFEVLLSTTGTAPADFTNTILPSASYSNTTYEEIIIDISAFTGNVFIAWRVSPGGLDGWRLYIDAVTIEDIPTCPEPTDLISSNVTSSGADLGWTSSATLFHVKYNPDADFDPETEGTLVTPDPTTNSCTLGSLTSNTTYYWYVQTDCVTDDVSPWVGSTFLTLCSSVTSFSENFDAVTTPDFPDCWAKVGTSGSVSTQTSSPNSSPNCLYIYSSSTSSLALVSMPPLSNAGDDTHWLKFQARGNFSANGVLEVGYLTDPLDANTFVAVVPVTITTTSYLEYTADLGTAPGANNYLAIRHTGSPANSILVDDVVWEEKPACLPPTDLLTSGITSSSADLEWTSTATLFNVKYNATLDFDPDLEGTSVTPDPTTNTASLSGLSSNTTYYWYVRADCGGSGVSTWAGSNTFITECDIYTPDYNEDFTTFLPECWDEADDGDEITGPTGIGSGSWDGPSTAIGSGSARINLYTTTRSDWLLSPDFNLSAGGYQVEVDVAVTTFFGSSPDAMGSDDAVQLLYTEDGSTWNNITTWTVADALPNTPTTFIFPLSSTATSVQFGILATDGPIDDLEDYDFHVDNFQIRTPPSCPEPSTLLTSNITTSSAQLDWTETGTATTWDIVVGAAGFDPDLDPSVFSTTYSCGDPCTYSYTIPSSTLSSGTEYDWYIRADCGSEITSIWAGPASFSTLPANDLCADAEVIDCNTVSVFGTTVGATIDDPGCGVTITAPGVWYKFTATGYDVVDLGMCTGFTTWDTKLSVFSGDCLNLVCVEYDDDGCDPGTQSTLTFQSELGIDYYILVHGYLTNTGGFELTIDCTPTYLVSGTLKYANTAMTPLDNSTVDLYDDTPTYLGSTTTSPLGYYEARLFAGNYSIEASTTKPRDGTNILDAINTRQYLGGGYPMDALQQSAADVNSNANVDILDAIFMQQSLSGPQPAGWTAPDFVFSNPSFEVIDADLPNQDTWSLCSGDPNGTYVPLYTCADPTGLGATNITHISADLTWTSNSGLSTIEWGAAGFSLGAGTPVSAVTSPYALGGLTASTSYDFYVQDDCSPYAISGWTGPYNFSTNDPPPANDDCGGAFSVTVNPDLSCGSVTSGTVASATASPEDNTACFGTENDDVWFTFQATETSHQISLINVANGTTDLYHSVWEGTCPGGLTLVPGSCSDPNTSTVTGLTPGTTYYIRVYSYTSTAGQTTTFDVCVGVPAGPPANDDLCNAAAITVGAAPIAGDNTSSTGETWEVVGSCWSGVVDNTVWYSFVAPASGNATISTDFATGMTDSQLTLYNLTGGDCSNPTLVELDCSQDDGSTGSGYMSIINATGLTSGTTYYIQMDGYFSAVGDFLIEVTDPGK